MAQPEENARADERPSSASYKWNKFPPDVLPLWVGDMDFRSPSCVADALAARGAANYFGYEFYGTELKKALLAWHQRRHGLEASPESLIYFPGVVASLNMVLAALRDRIHTLAVLPPVYAPILKLGRSLGLASVEVPLLFQNGRASLDLPALDAAAEHGLEAVILCNPQNPLGTCFTRAELAALGELAQRRNLLVLSDEIWADLIHAGNRYVPATSVPELAPRCVSFHAFSKTFSMPSTGFSWACIPDSGLRSELEQRLAGLNPEANTFGRAAALAAATQGEAWLEETLALLARNRALAARFALEVLGQSEGATPEAGTFAWLDFRSTPFADAPQARLLETARVALSAGTDFGTQGRGYARLNFACPTPRLREALDRIAKALHSPFDPRP